MNVLAFGASYSQSSINKELATYVSRFFREGNEVEVMDLNQFDMPLFTVDRESAMGSPMVLDSFLEKLDWADFLIISMAEHNGAYTAAFKNLFDWASRKELEMFAHTKLFVLSTSPGGRGGQSVLQIALDRFPRHGAEILDSFSLPSFNENYSYKEGIVNENLKTELLSKVDQIKQKL